MPAFHPPHLPALSPSCSPESCPRLRPCSPATTCHWGFVLCLGDFLTIDLGVVFIDIVFYSMDIAYACNRSCKDCSILRKQCLLTQILPMGMTSGVSIPVVRQLMAQNVCPWKYLCYRHCAKSPMQSLQDLQQACNVHRVKDNVPYPKARWLNIQPRQYDEPQWQVVAGEHGRRRRQGPGEGLQEGDRAGRVGRMGSRRGTKQGITKAPGGVSLPEL